MTEKKNELSITDLDFGGIDAESDDRLQDYFVTTPYVRYALEGRKTIFVGRKGSGKSALFRQIPELVAKSDSPNRLVLSLTPDQYAWSALKSYKEQGILGDQAHSNVWKLTIAIELSLAIANSNFQFSADTKEQLKPVRAFLKDNGLSDKVTHGKGALSFLKSQFSFNVSAFGFGVGAGRGPSQPKAPITPEITSELMSRLSGAIREQGVQIALDRLDDSWDGTEDAKSLLVGLLKAAKDLNDEFRISGSEQILRALVFLRSDIYDILTFGDKDKHRPLEVHIRWTPQLLGQMVQNRLPAGTELSELFEPGDMRGSTPPFSYIVKRTFLRPREVLQYIDACITFSDEGESHISKQVIRDAESSYSTAKVKDLKQEYSTVLPEFDDLLECFRQGAHRYDSLEDLGALLDNKASLLVQKYGVRHLLEQLFDFSVIGVRLNDAGSTRFKAEDENLALPTSGTVYIHQSLHKGLNIIEARKSQQVGG